MPDPREHNAPIAATRIVSPTGPAAPSNFLAPEEKVSWRERKRRREELPTDKQEALDKFRRAQIDEVVRASRPLAADIEARRAELAREMAEGHLSPTSFSAACKALDDELEAAQSSQAEAPECDHDFRGKLPPDAERVLREMFTRGLPGETWINPQTGLALDSWDIQTNERDTSGLLREGGLVLGNDPRWFDRVRLCLKCGRPKKLTDDELEPLPAPPPLACPDCGTTEVNVDPPLPPHVAGSGADCQRCRRRFPIQVVEGRWASECLEAVLPAALRKQRRAEQQQAVAASLKVPGTDADFEAMGLNDR